VLCAILMLNICTSKSVRDEGVAYEIPDPLTFEHTLGRFDVRDGKLVVAASGHFPDQAAGRSVIEPFLKSWEIATDLESNLGRFVSSSSGPT
jgi:hypothetical protein